jgi:type I restriction enzyme S subunit
MPKIDQSAVENATLCLPSLDTQREVVDKISEIGRVAMKLNADMKLAECKADRLRASLLTEGFAGRLVPQDPDDEPASVLLKRIKTDRVAQPKPKQARRNTDPDQERML